MRKGWERLGKYPQRQKTKSSPVTGGTGLHWRLLPETGAGKAILAKLGATPPFRKTKPEQSQENGRSPAGGLPAASAKEKGYAGADDFFDASTQKKEGFRSPASETLH